MKTAIATVFGIAISFASGGMCAASSGAKSLASASGLPAAFEPNRGQAPAKYDLVAKGFGYWVGISPQRAELILARIPETGKTPLSLVFAGSTGASTPELLEPLKTTASYLIGKQSIGGIPTFAKVRYANVWPGIDVVYYGTGKQLEYDFVLAPGANPNAIRMRFEGVKAVNRSPHGNLMLMSESGRVTQTAPVAYQDKGAGRAAVQAKYKILPGNTVALQLGAYDRSKGLVIDPVVLYSNEAVGVAVAASMNATSVASDSLGNSYFLGTTVPEQENGGSYRAVYISELDNNGHGINNTSFIAPDGDTFGSSIAIDNNSNVYVAGYTNSPRGLIPSANGFQASSGGGTDAFLAKFSPLQPNQALSPLYATYIGGTGIDAVSAMAVDTNGHAYLVGISSSTTGFPASGTPPAASAQKGFLIAVNTATTGSASKLYGYFIGGSGGSDQALGVAVDANSNVYAGGVTTSTDFAPVASAGYQLTKTTTTQDGFLVEFNSSGSAIWSTFFPFAPVYAVAQFNNRYAYVAGQTSGTMVTTSNAYQPATGANHAFFADFDTTASGAGSLVYATNLSSSGTDTAYGVAANTAGIAYITGTTSSTTFPVTGSPLVQGSYPGASQVAFLSFLNPNQSGTSSLTYSTFLSSGSTSTVGTSVSSDRYNQAAVAITTYSGTSPTGGLALKIGSQIWNPTFFVTQQYLDILNRQPDQSGLNYWVNQLTSGNLSGTALAAQFFESSELYQGGLEIIKYYIAVLGRDPDFAGWQNWFSNYQNNPTQANLNTILGDFINSPEFSNTYGNLTNGQFVTLVYQNVLGRAPDQQGNQYWVGVLNNGQMTRTQVFESFIASLEFNATVAPRAYADLLYIGFLRRTPEATGRAFWTNVLNGVVTISNNQLVVNSTLLGTVVNYFVSSPEYVGRFE